MSSFQPDQTDDQRALITKTISVKVENTSQRNAPMKIWANFVGLTSSEGVALGAPRLEERSTLCRVTYGNG